MADVVLILAGISNLDETPREILSFGTYKSKESSSTVTDPFSEWNPSSHLSGSTSGLFGHSVPVVCGGYNHDINKITNVCHFPNGTMKMAMQREFASSVSLFANGTQVLWITGKPALPKQNVSFNPIVLGGKISPFEESLTETTEILFGPGSNPLRGPNLPSKMNKHCAAAVNSSWTIIIGGFRYTDSLLTTSNVWTYDWYEHIWMETSDLREARADFACGVIKDTMDSTKVALAIGGQVVTLTVRYYQTKNVFVFILLLCSLGSKQSFLTWIPWK